MDFVPNRVFFEEDALKYERGRRLHQLFLDKGTEIKTLGANNRVIGVPGNTPQQAYAEGKKTLVVGVRKTLNFSPCKPSAHYQLPLATSCAGKCEYCYLNTQLGSKPYLRVYVNLDEILQKTQEYIDKDEGVIVFEASATSDPIPVEPYTGALKETIMFFSKKTNGKLRFVTKFTDVDSILSLVHNGNTTVRFSINTEQIIRKYEHQTPPLIERVKASGKIFRSKYPMGFIIAPVFIYEGWQKEYRDMLENIKTELGDIDGQEGISFEVISHRFTARAKQNILRVFPQTDLPMDESERKFKFGQFGYGKYIYPDEIRKHIKDFFSETIVELFPNADIKYVI